MSDSNSHNLDSLRAMAVLFVSAGHFLQTWRIESVAGFVTIYDLAQMGVLMFFVHTSLVLLLSLRRNTKAGPLSFQKFYVRRAFRIYPLAMVAVALMLAARIPPFPTLPYVPPSSATRIANFALVQNLTGSPSLYAPLWSLPYEVQMYLVLPLLFLFIERWRSRWVAPALWASSTLVVAALGVLGFKSVEILYYVPCFIGGVVAYQRWSRRSHRLPFWGWPLMIASCVLLRSTAGALHLRHAVLPVGWICCFLLGWFAPSFQEVRNGWIRAGAATVAKYSYGIYLSNGIVLWLSFVVLKQVPLPVQFVVWILLSVVVPVAAFHCIEKPMMRAGQKVTRMMTRTTEPLIKPSALLATTSD